MAELDVEKAVLLAELEKSLNERQEAILMKARQQIDAVETAANQQKLAIYKEAQILANEQVDQITEKVAELAAEDAQRRLQSTTQTVRSKHHFFKLNFFSIVLFRLLQQKQLHQVKLMHLEQQLQQLQQQPNHRNLIIHQAIINIHILLFFFILIPHFSVTDILSKVFLYLLLSKCSFY